MRVQNINFYTDKKSPNITQKQNTKPSNISFGKANQDNCGYYMQSEGTSFIQKIKNKIAPNEARFFSFATMEKSNNIAHEFEKAKNVKENAVLKSKKVYQDAKETLVQANKLNNRKKCDTSPYTLKVSYEDENGKQTREYTYYTDKKGDIQKCEATISKKYTTSKYIFKNGELDQYNREYQNSSFVDNLYFYPNKVYYVKTTKEDERVVLDFNMTKNSTPINYSEYCYKNSDTYYYNKPYGIWEVKK